MPRLFWFCMLLACLLMSLSLPVRADDDTDIQATPSPTPNLDSIRLGTQPLPPGLVMTGELALRYERDLNQPVKADRLRYRNRLGWVYQPDKDWTLAVHVRTGNPFFENSTWTTIDHNQVDGFTADEAYVRYTPTSHPGWQFDLGEFGRPWDTNPVYSGAIWSTVMKVGGFNMRYTAPQDDWFVSMGPWFAMPQDSGSFGAFQVLGIQSGKAWRYQHKQRMELSLGLLYFGMQGSGGLDDLLSRNHGNATVKIDGQTQFASGYQIFDPRLDYYFATVRGIPLAASVEYFVNMAASVPQVNVNGKSGYLIGITGGKVEYPGKFSVRLQYFQVGQDSVFTPIVQGDFVQATNFDGFYFNLTVPITPRLSMALVEERTDQSAVNPVENRTAVDVYWRY